QQDIDNGLLSYTSTGGSLGTDSFDFLVDDPFGADTGVQTFNINIVPPVPPTTTAFQSIGSEDGWVRESKQFSEVGGSTSTVAQLAGVGDTVGNEQYMLVYSFDTSTLPAGAVIVGGRLTVRRVGIQGNPTNLGLLEVDVMSGFFGPTAALEPLDFQHPATAPDAGTVAAPTMNLDYATAEFNGAGAAAVNPGGRTQVRVRFDIPDNGNLAYDYLLLGMAENRTLASRPVLEVDYFVFPPPPQAPGKTGTKIDK
ncbi:hypothetical protein HZA57_06445, partial [Candidatus Poribacteria bacterium]|nr:hypothetical protein [Candidatus Poribacteria bacterium]